VTSINDLTVITAVGHTVQSLQHLLATTPYRGFPIVSDTAHPVLLGYISRNELSFALKSRNLSPDTQAYFCHQPFADPLETLDLRPWMDQTPITMSIHTSFEIVLNMFQRLGLRNVHFVNKGVLEGLLTKKDLWYILDGVGRRGDRGVGAGVLRTRGGEPEETGLLQRDDEPRIRAFSPLETQNDW
jgi:chloride channel 3/4/5